MVRMRSRPAGISSFTAVTLTPRLYVFSTLVPRVEVRLYDADALKLTILYLMPSSALAANSLETLEVSVEVSLALKSMVSSSIRRAGMVSMVRNGTRMLTSDCRNGLVTSVDGGKPSSASCCGVLPKCGFGTDFWKLKST